MKRQRYRRDSIVRYALNPEEHRKLATRIQPYLQCPNEQVPSVIRGLRRAVAGISNGVDSLLDDMRNGEWPPGAIVFEGVPFDASVQRGPIDPEVASAGKLTKLSEAMLLGFVAQLGEPYAVRQESLRLVNNLAPTRSALEKHTGLGSRKRLGLHIEHAAARLLRDGRAPDGLGLVGVSKERDGSPSTLLADGRLALNSLGPREQRLLRDPANYRHRFPVRWRAEPDSVAVPGPVVTGSVDVPSFTAALYDDMIEPVNEAASRALETLREELEAVAVKVSIEPGVLVLIDNHFVFHGRESFEPTFDEIGRPYRWLQRVFWISSLRRLSGWERRGRIVTASETT